MQLVEKQGHQLVQYVRNEFIKLADAQKAKEMAAYMRTEMPFYGIQKPERLPIYKLMFKTFRPIDRAAYENNVSALWNQPHREEKYAALEYACFFTDFITSQSLPLYERLVREGSWWDFVDVIAINLVGHILLKERETARSVINEWVDDESMWIRRSAIICHNHHRKSTDETQLFEHCLRLAPEKEFFIRKAIGWALREYSYANPAAVKKFLLKHKAVLSPLSVREGAKRMLKQGLIDPEQLG